MVPGRRIVDGPVVVILVDYRGAFWSSKKVTTTPTTMDCSALRAALAERGFRTVLMGFDQVVPSDRWRAIPVVYTSSEDPGLQYKSYIEDVVLALDRCGARLLPRFDLLRAHHNKVYMELLRRILIPDDPLADGTAAFGTVEEYRRSARAPGPPVFVKGAAGAGSETVRFAGGPQAAMSAARAISRTGWGGRAVRSAVKAVLRPGFTPPSAHRGKFVVQRALPSLDGDFKVLRYGRRYYAVHRGLRPDAPTASGAGNLDFDIASRVDPARLLAYAGEVGRRIDSPFLSMDIAQAGDRFFLLEFQAVCFGSATLQWSSHHFVATDDGFVRRPNSLSLEQVFAEAVDGALAEEGVHAGE